MLFPVIDCDDVVQVNDRFRILADKSYKTPDSGSWTKVEIQPEASASFIEVTGDLTKPFPERKWFLDYQYSSAGNKVVSVRLTAGATVTTSTKTVQVLTAVQDNLFSKDDDLKAIQEDILKLLPEGKASFVYKHRAAQAYILDWLWNNGYYKGQFQQFTKSDVIDVQFISDWSTYVCLRMIYEASSNQANDIFAVKAGEMMNKEERAREKFLIKLDADGDGTLGNTEGAAVTSRRLIRV